jgi:hypothetical protein
MNVTTGVTNYTAKRKGVLFSTILTRDNAPALDAIPDTLRND